MRYQRAETIVSGILDVVQQQLTGGTLQQIAQQAGVDPNVAQRAVNVALPMILGGMAQHAQQPQNAEAIHAEADKFGNPQALFGNLSGALGGLADRGGLMGKILGGGEDRIATAVANAVGIDKAKATQLMQMLIPIVMSAIALRKNQQGLAPQQVPAELQQAQQQAQQQSAKPGGVLGSLIGDVLDRGGPRA